MRSRQTISTRLRSSRTWTAMRNLHLGLFADQLGQRRHGRSPIKTEDNLLGAPSRGRPARRSAR
jgi:hypothetical protein